MKKQGHLNSIGPQGILVRRCGRIEDGLARGEPRQPVVDGL